ncbi:hypothetical protein DFH27DRAFT_575695 [Peziza echinospora]|nr:hypothetical protein DFH27DRAFT_575695 [Peziza echinospora]
MSDITTIPTGSESATIAVSEPAQDDSITIKRQPMRPKKPNYNLIHADPLPLRTVPLPPLIPHNPLSWLHIIYTFLFPPTSAYSHPVPVYVGEFSTSTRSVHVTDAASVQGLWCRGFFGKGNLSRSEPTWLTRTQRRLGVIGKNEKLTAEELTERRRTDRREFKKDRAKKERERLDQILADEGKLSVGKPGVDPESTCAISDAGDGTLQIPSASIRNRSIRFGKESSSRPSISNLERPVVDIEDLEHLQLTFEEAFFLSYGLGVLQIHDGFGNTISNTKLLTLCRMTSYIPTAPMVSLSPDDPFMVSYIAYHHFRSLGWVVKSGVKFAVDYLLYNRGPAFSHAEFAVTILPSYTHAHWADDRARKTKETPDWHWLHCVNRVSSQVKKTLILCYVDIPSPQQVEEADGNIPAMLALYKVREVGLRRWIPSRNRD